ncbi:MAG: hypothetical protein LBQ44_09575 [Treponema sp.]|jgi:hypothetical protein|nr:hypothetical protein [Treponema sp.]
MPRFNTLTALRVLGTALCFCLPLLFIGALPPEGEIEFPPEAPFPSVYFTEYYERWIAYEAARPYWAPTKLENQSLAGYRRNSRPIFLNDDVLAFYGHPSSPNMGILGRFSLEELDVLLDGLAAEYDRANGARGIRKALYLIYGTVHPRGEIGRIDDAELQRYIRFAMEKDMLVFIDHQIGKYDPLTSLKEMLPYLQYRNVHLALDPEWRTDKPMRRIGSVTAEEINAAQEIMSRYLAEHRLPGERMLVIHQFDSRMIQDREKVRSGYSQVTLVHCSDGFGSPALKRGTYGYNAQAKNMPVKGFKLFYNFNIPGAGYDEPLLEPEEVFQLNPRPALIMYQ